MPGFNRTVCIKKMRYKVQIILLKSRDIHITFIDFNVDIIPDKILEDVGVLEKNVLQFRGISLQKHGNDLINFFLKERFKWKVKALPKILLIKWRDIVSYSWNESLYILLIHELGRLIFFSECLLFLTHHFYSHYKVYFT